MHTQTQQTIKVADSVSSSTSPRDRKHYTLNTLLVQQDNDKYGSVTYIKL